jgi:hypothetical protein
MDCGLGYDSYVDTTPVLSRPGAALVQPCMGWGRGGEWVQGDSTYSSVTDTHTPTHSASASPCVESACGEPHNILIKNSDRVVLHRVQHFYAGTHSELFTAVSNFIRSVDPD